MSTTFMIQTKNLIKYFLYGKNPSSPMTVEKFEQKFYIDFLQPGMTVFDVGANIGELTLLFSRFVGNEGRVHSFEASQSIFNKLCKIVEFSNRENVTCNRYIITNQIGKEIIFVYDDYNSGFNSIANRPLEDYGLSIKPDHQEEVSSITIDEYCKNHSIESIDLLKLDIEGAEYQAILGAKNLFQTKRIKCCVFEYGGTTYDMGNCPRMLQDFFDDHDYKIRNIVKGDPLFPGGENAKSARFSLHIAEPRL